MVGNELPGREDRAGGAEEGAREIGRVRSLPTGRAQHSIGLNGFRSAPILTCSSAARSAGGESAGRWQRKRHCTPQERPRGGGGPRRTGIPSIGNPGRSPRHVSVYSPGAASGFAAHRSRRTSSSPRRFTSSPAMDRPRNPPVLGGWASSVVRSSRCQLIFRPQAIEGLDRGRTGPQADQSIKIVRSTSG